MLPLPRKFRTQKAKARYRRALMVRSGIIAVCILLCFGACIGITHLSFLRINSVVVHSPDSIPQQDVTQTVSSLIAGSYLGIIPKSFIFAYPKGAIHDAIVHAYPRTAQANVSVSGFDVLTIDIKDRTPAALWCGDIAPEEQGTELVFGTCYYMDKDGFIFEQASPAPSASYVHYYGAIVHGAPLGQYFLEQATFTRLVTLVGVFEKAGYPASALLVVDNSDAELYLQKGIKILLSYNTDPYTIRDTLTSALASDALKNSNLSTLEYIDVRFGNKVYYKFRGTQSTSTASAHP